MISKIDDLKDKIFDLEMYNVELRGASSVFYLSVEDQDDLQKIIQENQCWLEYYKQELLDLQNTEMYDE